MSKETASDYKWVILATAVIVALTCVPYLFGVSVTPPGYRFLGLTHNIDDGAVYLSWIRQAADGHVLIRNHFTNESQPGGSFNVLFLAMGGFARLTHLSCIDACHVFRILLGIGLLFAIFKFSGLFISDRRARLLLVPLVGLSSGIGWLIPGAGFPIGPVDVWQPEAITFLSIYLNPLFIAGLLLMLGSLHHLILMERTGRARHAVAAGLFLLVLGNVHTYDVLTVACVWTAYVATRAILERTINWRGVALSMLACIVALPSLAYQFHIYQADAIFRARANTVIASPPITSYFAGYGLILLTAIAGAVMLFVEQRRAQDRNDGLRYPFLLPVVWSVVGFAIPYIPMAQQRKLIMGLHIPLCILAAVVIARLGAKLKPVIATGLGCILLLVLFQTNSEFLSLDMALLCDGRTVVATTLPYMSADQLKSHGLYQPQLRPEPIDIGGCPVVRFPAGVCRQARLLRSLERDSRIRAKAGCVRRADQAVCSARAQTRAAPRNKLRFCHTGVSRGTRRVGGPIRAWDHQMRAIRRSLDIQDFQIIGLT